MNWFKRSMVLGAAVAALSFSACAPQNSSSQRSSGSLALSADDATLYAVDTDNAAVVVIDTKTQAATRAISVGKDPVRVLVTADETVFVTNRGDRSVSVIRKGDSVEAARLAVGVEPAGMALTPDGKTLLVVSATSLSRPDVGTLTAFDVGTLEKQWETEVGEEPRAVAVVAGNRALVSLYKQGELVEVNLSSGQVVSANTGIYEQANATRINGTGSGFGGAVSTFRTRAMNDLIVTPQGDRVFAPVVWAREDSIGRRPTTAGGYYSAGGPCNIGAVATAGIVTVDTAGAPQPQVDDITSCFSSGTNPEQKDFPPSTLASSDNTNPIQGPTVGVMDPTGEWVMVLNRESKNLAFLPGFKRSGSGIDFNSTGSSVRALVEVGHGADGLAVTADFCRAYVYNQFDHTVQTFKGACGAGAPSTSTAGVTPVGRIDLLATGLPELRERLTPLEAAGRRMFFDARNPKLSSNTTTVACSTCHLEGREDGHVWQFPDGPRQTPMLGGRKLLSTAPYHWSGEFEDLEGFNVHTITERMGGSGLTPGEQQELDTYIDRLPLADNPLRTSMPTEQAARGQAAFQKAECGSCHAGDTFSNTVNADVGTLRLNGSNPDNGVVLTRGFNVPSLLGIGRTAPYLHDGAQLSLDERVFSNPGDKHGKTSLLSQAEKGDLVAWLKTL